MMANSFAVLGQSAQSQNSNDYSNVTLTVENKALPIQSTLLKSFELSQCEIDLEIVNRIKSFLSSCQNIGSLKIA